MEETRSAYSKKRPESAGHGQQQEDREKNENGDEESDKRKGQEGEREGVCESKSGAKRTEGLTRDSTAVSENSSLGSEPRRLLFEKER